MLQKIQRFGGAMFAPAMLFSISGLMVGVSALATSADIVGDLAVYGTPWYVFWTIIQRGSWTVFKRLPLLFAVALPIGLAQKQPARCCLEALVAYFAYCFFLSEIIKLSGDNLGLKYPSSLTPASGITIIDGIKTLDTLVSKEGLGMTNGTCAMTSVGALALYDTICAAQLGDVIASMSFEGLTGLRNAFDPRIHQVRGQKGQMLVAANMRKLLDGSEILDNCQKDRVQDAYALRCIPQLHGACRDALDYVREKVEIELNAVTDNPLMFLDDEAVISGGNFHGEPMALPFDFLGIAASELADASERRTERMVNPALSNGLTAFLTTEAGVNSGFMIVQYAAASMVSENKIYAHPASVDSIPSSANQEDIVSMGTTAARKAKMILQNTQDVLADELMTACQAIDIRRRLNTHGQGMTPLHEALYQHVREKVAFYEIDREIWPDIRAVEAMIRSGELLDIVKEYIPDFE